MSEFDYLGKEDSELARDEDGDEPNQETRKSLEKDFEVAAEEDATEAESPEPVAKTSALEDPAESTTIPDFRINPVAATYSRRPVDSYAPRPMVQSRPRPQYAGNAKRDYEDLLKMKLEDRVGRNIQSER